MSEKRDDQTMRFVAGCRMSGYLPDAETCLFDTSEEAMTYVRNLMRDAAYAEDRWSDEDIAAIDTIAADPDGEFGVTVYGWHYFVQRSL